MYGIAAGLVLLGAICGTTLRLMPFVIVLVVAAAIAGVSTAVQGDGNVLLNVALAVVALQVGYGFGIVGRALLRSWRRDGGKLGRSTRGRDGRLPTEQKQQ